MEKLEVLRVYKRGKPGYVKPYLEIRFKKYARLATTEHNAFKVNRLGRTFYLPTKSLKKHDIVWVDTEDVAFWKPK